MKLYQFFAEFYFILFFIFKICPTLSYIYKKKKVPNLCAIEWLVKIYVDKEPTFWKDCFYPLDNRNIRIGAE